MSTSLAILAPSSVPFQLGGAENFWWGLHRALSRYTPFQVELIKIPSREASFSELVASYKAFSQLDLSHFDLVLTSKYPAWMVQHRQHIIYMQHTLRGLYDTYVFTGLPLILSEYPAKLDKLMTLIRKEKPNREDLALAFELIEHAQADKSLPAELFAFPGPLIRELVHFFDRVALAPSEIYAYAAISRNVSQRQDYFPQTVKPFILHHPPDLSDFFCSKGRYIFTASRLNGSKRLELIVKAMAYVTSPVALKIAGTGPDLAHLQDLARNDARIEFLGYVPREALPSLYANALFVPFVPYDEDYGLITIEAMKSGKAVVTTNDAGGVCEFVENGVTGLSTTPDPRALGEAFQKLLDDPKACEAMGKKALERVQDITWENTVQKLLQHVSQKSSAVEEKGIGCVTTKKLRKILVLSTFPIGTILTGGPRRLLAFCSSLARRYSVVLLALGSYDQTVREERLLLPNLRQIVLPWSLAERSACQRLQEETGISLDDIGLMQTADTHSELLQVLREEACADLVVASHPYLYPAIAKILPDTPLLYDAHNVESELKAQVIGQRAPDLLGEVAEVEGACARKALRVTCCSPYDATRLISLYGLSDQAIAVFPNGCDSQNIHFAGAEERRALRRRLGYPREKLCLFLGSEHRPNTQAAMQIIAMAKELPSVQFLLAGGVSTQRALQQASLPKNVHLLGLVSEAEKNVLLKAANVGLNPITQGSGTNLKILEYFACGLESLSTPFGLRGLQGEALAKAHLAELSDFPKVLSQILAHPQSEADLQSLSKLVRSQYAWKYILDPLVDLVEAILQPSH